MARMLLPFCKAVVSKNPRMKGGKKETCQILIKKKGRKVDDGAPSPPVVCNIRMLLPVCKAVVSKNVKMKGYLDDIQKKKKNPDTEYHYQSYKPII